MTLPEIPWWTVPLALGVRFLAYSLLFSRAVRGLRSARSPFLLAAAILVANLVGGWCLLRASPNPLRDLFPFPYSFALPWQTWVYLGNWLAGVLVWAAVILVFTLPRVAGLIDVLVYSVLGSSTSLFLSLAMESLGASFSLDYPYWIVA